MSFPQRVRPLLAALGTASLCVVSQAHAAELNSSTPQAPQQAAPQLIEAPPAQKPPLEIELSADQQGFDLLANRFVASGNAKAMLAGGRLLADRIEYESASRTIYASGSVRFQRGSQYLQASKLRYSLIENSGEIEDVYGVLDLDSAALDLNPAQPPSVALLPLSYWPQQLSPELAQPEFQPEAEAAATAPTAAQRQSDLSSAPLRDPATVQGLGWGAQALSGSSAAGDGTPTAVPEDNWRMPPVALSPAAQTMACPPALPPIPDWHPYPWAATLWSGQMIDANFGDTFVFKGRMRPEYLWGVGLNKRLVQAGPLALEFDSNAMLHHANEQAGGAFNQAVAYANTPAQTFGEFTWSFGLRAWLQPWLSLGFFEGVSLNTNVSNYEKTFRENYTTFLNYLGFEIEALVAPEWSVVGRIHHRSGAYGTYSGVSEGSNAYLIGMRYRFGSSPAQPPGVAMAPPDGCADPSGLRQRQPRPLSEQLNQVALGSAQQATGRPPAPSPSAAPNPLSPGQQEELRHQAIAAVADQRVENVRYRGSLTVDRRVGVTTSVTNLENQYGGVRPSQQLSLNLSGNNQRMVQGVVSRWRMQANRITITPDGWQTDRAAFSNDPYTPSQAWVDATGVVAHLEPNGDLVLQAKRNQLILEDRLPIPLQRNQRFEKNREVENRWVLGVDSEDRDGMYLGYNMAPIDVGRNGGKLKLQPQFMVRRALDGTTSSYVLPGEPIGGSAGNQPTRIGDLFGLLARLETPWRGFTVRGVADLSTFDPSNFANGSRSWLQLDRGLKLPVLGQLTARGFAAYRYRVWNGSLGEQDIYTAFGGLVEQNVQLPNWGKLSNNLFWRAGFGNFQGTDFGSTNLADLWRGSLYASLNSSLPLWTGKALNPTSEAATRYSPVPVVPGLVLNTNLNLNLAYYGDGTNQQLAGVSGGPTLTLGHLQKRFFDYTQLTITGGASLRQGLSPFSFDRAVDLSTLGIGLTQQLAGPLLLSGGVGFNIDGTSGYYGDVVDSYVELRWQRRAYELAIYYSPHQGIGGLRVKLNDFSFSGTGLPFVPYSPGGLATDATIQRRGF